MNPKNNSEIQEVGKHTEAIKIIKVHSVLAGVAALSPIPITDVAGIGGVQLTMLIRLSKLYNIDVNLEIFKDMIIGSMGGLITETIISWAVSLVKAIPGIGTLVGEIMQPPIAFAITYAMGRGFLYFIESDADITKTTSSEFGNIAKGYMGEGKKEFLEQKDQIIAKSQVKEYLEQEFQSIIGIMKSFNKGEDFLKKLSSLYKEAYLKAKTNLDE